MKREEFDEKVERFLSKAAQCMDGDAMLLGHELVLDLARFYADRRILTVLYCSSCGYEGTPDEESKLPDGTLADKCPSCGREGCMCSYTAKQWRKKQKEWGVTQ